MGWWQVFRDRAASAAVVISACPVFFALSVLWGQANAIALNRDLLWRVVHLMCVPGAEHGNPAPCSLVDLSHGIDTGVAILAVPFKRSEILVVPTRRITGIESPVLQGDVANYWNEAWHQRSMFDSRLGRPVSRDWVGMAVNSQVGRDQDQLHIHVDCVDSGVRNTLRNAEIGPKARWSKIRIGPSGHSYLVRGVAGADLSKVDPFRIVHDAVPSLGRDMGKVTIVVIGAEFHDGEPGFYVLAHRADTRHGDYGSGVELLDNSCRLGR
jgi:CDP-diacylglycerol pyrophosphatase